MKAPSASDKQQATSNRESGFLGFTLVELLVVLGIVALVVGISVPALTQFMGRMRLKTAVRQTVGLVSLARSLAISSHADHALVFDPQAMELRVEKVSSGESLEHVVRFPLSVTVDLQIGGQPASDNKVIFRATGALTGRSAVLTFADKERQNTITISGTTGAISVD